MKTHRKNNNSGFTLIELVVVIGLLGLITTMVFTIFGFGNRILDESRREFKLQTASRLTLMNTSNIIRYSTAVFTVPESSFREDNLDEGWDYIGIHNVEISPGVTGQEIVRYTYNSVTGTHNAKVLIAAEEDVAYKFVFTKVNPMEVDSLLKFSIQCFRDGVLDEFGDPASTLDIISEVESINSLQVVDLSTPTDPAVAIAFRLQDRPMNVVGHVAMVLDKSGSMADALDGHSPWGSEESRMDILKREARNMINNFALEHNIDVSIIPFETTANDAHDFLNAKTQTSDLRSIISGLNAYGGTNTGDGLRRAYWKLYNANHIPGVTVSNYVIILVDGVTTYATLVSSSNWSVYKANDGDVANTDRAAYGGQIVGNGSSLDPYGTAYVNQMGTLLRTGSFAKAYVIGFSSINSELNSVNDIATACGAPSSRVYRVGTADDLNVVFEEIRQDIVNDLWYLQGPRL